MMNELREHKAILWAESVLDDLKYERCGQFKLIRKRPWSIIYRSLTNKKYLYLKQEAIQLDQEVILLPYLVDYFQSIVPRILGVNKNLGCMILDDAGAPLRDLLRKGYQMNLVYKVLSENAFIQKKLSTKIEPLIALGIPDWRTFNIPTLFFDLLQDTHFLMADGLTEMEITRLTVLYPNVRDLCFKINQYNVPETLEHGDFKDTNILINDDNQLVISDWNEAVITHPFFSLEFFLIHANHDHALSPSEVYEIKNGYLTHWLHYEPKERLNTLFSLIQYLGPIKLALSAYRMKHCPGMIRYKGLVAKPLQKLLK